MAEQPIAITTTNVDDWYLKLVSNLYKLLQTDKQSLELPNIFDILEKSLINFDSKTKIDEIDIMYHKFMHSELLDKELEWLVKNNKEVKFSNMPSIGILIAIGCLIIAKDDKLQIPTEFYTFIQNIDKNQRLMEKPTKSQIMAFLNFVIAIYKLK